MLPYVVVCESDEVDMHFATVLEGKITPLALFHLENLLKFGASKICVMSSGMSLNTLANLGINNICLHNSQQYIPQYSGDETSLSEITYFDPRFARVNILKWYLIKESLTELDSARLVFSDMDVFWNRAQSMRFRNFFYGIGNSFVYVQQDGEEYCTGIMIWEKRHLHLQFLEKLIEFHKQSFQTKPLMDQEVFNFLASSRSASNLNLIKFLPERDFVIGRKLISKVLLKDSLLQSIAVHANYIIGQYAKLRVLEKISVFIVRPTLKHFIVTFSALVWYQKIKLRYQIWQRH